MRQNINQCKVIRLLRLAPYTRPGTKESHLCALTCLHHIPALLFIRSAGEESDQSREAQTLVTIVQTKQNSIQKISFQKWFWKSYKD